MTTLLRSTIRALLVLGAAGCSSSPGPGGASTKASAGLRTTAPLGANVASDASDPVSTCILGWWLSQPAPCSPGATTAVEAKAPDCQSVSFVQYLESGAATEGVYSYSSSLGTMSGMFGSTTYLLNGNALQVLPGTHAAQTSCASGQLSMDGQSLTAAPQNIASALAGATAGDGSACPIATCVARFSSVPAM